MSTGNENLGFHVSDINLSEANLEGDVYNPEVEKNISTIDEPIKKTIIRDLKAVGIKFYHVLYPKNNKFLLKDWDLWGPLFLCTIISLILETSRPHTTSVENDGGPEFGQVFILFWTGSAVVTINAQLLGAQVSFLQTLCVLGYCSLPLTLATIACAILGLQHHTLLIVILKLVIGMLGFIWSTFSSTAFLHNCNVPNRKALVIYPIMLFYFFLSWMAVSIKSR